jgi:hypothetical protein
MSDNTKIDTNVPETRIINGVDDMDPNDPSIQALLKCIMFESTENLRLQKLAEIRKLTGAQSEIQFLSNLRRVFMFGSNDDGTFTVNDDLKKVLKKVSNPGSEDLLQLLSDMGLNFTATYTKDNFQGLFSDIEALDAEKSQPFLDQLEAIGITKGQIPTDEQLAALIETISKPENLELRKLVVDRDILTTKSSFTKAERENFVESIRLAIEQKNVIIEMNFQTVTRLQTEIDQRQQYVTIAGKIFNDMMKSIATKIGK